MRLQLLLLVTLLSLVSSRSLQKRDVEDKLKAVEEKLGEIYDEAKEKVDVGAEAVVDLLTDAYNEAAKIVEQGKEKAGPAYDKAVIVKNKLGDKLREIAEKLKEGAKAVENRVSDGMDTELRMIIDAQDAIADAYHSVKDWLSGHLGKRDLKSITVPLEEKLKAVEEQLGEIYEGAKEKVDVGAEAVVDLMTDAYNEAAKIVDQGKEKAGPAYDKAVEVKKTLGDKLREIAEKIEEKMKEGANAVENRVSDGLDTEIWMINDAQDTIADAYHSVKDWLKGHLGKRTLRDDMIIEKVPDKRGLASGNVIIEKVPYSAEVLRDVVKKIRDDLSTASDKVLENLEKFKAEHSEEIETAKTKLDALKEKIQPAFEKAYEKVLEKVEEFRTEHGEEIDMAEDKLNALREKLQPAFEEAYGKVLEKLEKFKAEHGDEIDTAKDKLNDLKEKIQPAFEKAYMKVLEDVEKFQAEHGDEIDAAKAKMNDLKERIQPAFEEAYEKVFDKVDEFKTEHADKIQMAKDKLNALKEKVQPAFEQAYENLEEAVSQGAGKVKEAVSNIKGWMWDVIDEYLEPYTDRRKRALKGYNDMTDEERAKDKSVITELKEALKDKFGVQDPDEGYRIDPETREKYAAVRKEFMKLFGQTGHEDLTDDEWKKNWGKVVDELKQVLANRQKRQMDFEFDFGIERFLKEEYKKISDFLKKIFHKTPEKFHDLKSTLHSLFVVKAQEAIAAAKEAKENFDFEQFKSDFRAKLHKAVAKVKQISGDLTERIQHGIGKRELKSYEQMSPEERQLQNALLAELRKKLQEKFGSVDPDAGFRPSPETRHRLKQILKQIRKDQGYEDLTESDWKEKYDKVVEELKARNRGA